jgi:hypothetical protein
MLPNLFRFATSELSQDAFLCWLLSWADTKHEKNFLHLHTVSKNLLTLIYQRAGVKAPGDFFNVEIRRQDGNIDVLCIINNAVAILIEDKAGSKQHSNQLERYKDYIFNELGFANDKVIPVYIQTRDQSNYHEVEKHGYLIIQRSDLLCIFESDYGKEARLKSDILEEFSSNLRRIEDDVQSFKTLPPEKWSRNSWKGFYMSLQNTLQDGNWDQVSNPSGGFLGFWWHFGGNKEYELYLQLEQEKFCFKIWVNDAKKRRNLRQHWFNQVVSKCPSHGLRARRPDRFGNGEYMTVAILDQEFRIVGDNGLIDMAEVLKIIQSAQSVLDDCL